MQKLKILILALVITLLAMQFNVAAPVQASAPLQTGDTGLHVYGAFLDLVARPGQVYVHNMIVGSGEQAPQMNISIEVDGFGESLTGEFMPLPADRDNSPYSARTFITNINQSSFRLDPGSSLPVAITIKIPQNFAANTRYAILYIRSEPTGASSSIGQKLTAIVPVVITPAGVQFSYAGDIKQIKINLGKEGQPVEVLTTFMNTGNRHYKVQGSTKIDGPDGQVLADLTMPLTGTSIIPTFSQQLRASYVPAKKYQPGSYLVEVKVTLEDGSLLDSCRATFKIQGPQHRKTPAPRHDNNPGATATWTYAPQILAALPSKTSTPQPSLANTLSTEVSTPAVTETLLATGQPSETIIPTVAPIAAVGGEEITPEKKMAAKGMSTSALVFIAFDLLALIVLILFLLKRRKNNAGQQQTQPAI